MKDIATLTADELRNLAIDFERNWTDRARALCELHRRAKASDALWDAAMEYRKASSNLHQAESPRQEDGVWFLTAQDAIDAALAAVKEQP